MWNVLFKRLTEAGMKRRAVLKATPTIGQFSGVRLFVGVTAVVLALDFFPGAHHAAAQVNGASAACTDFRLLVVPVFLEFDVTDEGWVWVQRSDASLPRYQSVSGVVVASDVAYNDTPANHNSHDVDFSILVDQPYDGLLSQVNRPNTAGRDDLEANDGPHDLRPPTRIGVEWELGTFPSERGKAVPQRYFPRWAWPSVGDRVWTNGHWVFDCGHGKEIGVFVPNPSQVGPSFLFVGQEYFRSEIHPARAIATMRQQADTLPGTGTTPVPVTATDLYIHGEAGFITDILNCGMSIIVDGVDGGGNPDTCPTKTTPIAETFDFDICLPPRPSSDAELVWRVENGPGNTVATAQPLITQVPAPPGCANDDVADARNPNDNRESYDLKTALHVRIPLAGSGVGDVETYARKIVTGWIDPPDPPLERLRLTLDRLNVHSSGDGGTFASDDGELTFSFVNVDRAPNEWIRIADYAPESNGSSVLNDYDPSLFGDAFTDLTGAVFDFYVRNGQDVGINANVYDQDCYDGAFGDHILSVGTYVSCAIDIDETGNNDHLLPIAVRLAWGSYGNPVAGLGDCPGVGAPGTSAPCNVTTAWTPRLKDFGPPLVIEPRPDYELDFTVEKLAPTDEDKANLKVEKTCTHEGEVLLVGKTLGCTITVSNLGPGLPRGVSVVDTIMGSLGPSQYTISTPTGAPCTLSLSGFSCSLDTLKVGGSVTINVTIVPNTPGTIVNGASASTDSADTDTTNNGSSSTTTVFLPVEIDIQPGMAQSSINVSHSGLIPVAILTTSTFDASIIDPSSVCFGDDGAASERNCTEAHGTGHLLDTSKDKLADLLLHYEVTQAGIDRGDTRACLTAITTAGIHVYGCDGIVAK